MFGRFSSVVMVSSFSRWAPVSAYGKQRGQPGDEPSKNLATAASLAGRGRQCCYVTNECREITMTRAAAGFRAEWRRRESQPRFSTARLDCLTRIALLL